jgi:hypothetical protein
MPQKPIKYRIKIWMICDCATKYTLNAKVYLGKENNEVDVEWQVRSSAHWFSLFLVRTEAGEM